MSAVGTKRREHQHAPRAAESMAFVRRPWASLPRGHTGPGRGHTDTGRGYTGGSLNRWTWSRETAISRHSSCRTSAWRQSSVPKPQAITRRQSPRREILSSSSSPMPIYLASFIRPSQKRCALFATPVESFVRYLLQAMSFVATHEYARLRIQRAKLVLADPPEA